VKLNEIGEFGFIERLKPCFDNLLQGNQVGIGDDCAVLSANEEEDWLITTDMLMEDVHFLRQAITPEQLGYKSLAVNLSDIAAMGGTPLGSFLSIAIPMDVDVEYVDAFMKGYHHLSEKYHTPLLGGDTTKSLKHIAINVCVIGRCPKGKARKRDMAEVGDIVCVTGCLGDSAGGLKVLLEELPLTKEHEELVLKHHLPEPRLDEGHFLAGFDAVHALMDLSDGIASDLVHILKSSGKSAVINVDALPLSEVLKKTAELQKWKILDLAVSGGEDYELLMTVDRRELELVQQHFAEHFGKPLYPVGEITEGEARLTWRKGFRIIDFRPSVFNHFRK
jgi:thiamine-monophosphate kinase